MTVNASSAIATHTQDGDVDFMTKVPRPVDIQAQPQVGGKDALQHAVLGTWICGRSAAMISVASGVRVWIATGHTDMRRGMNTLALQVQEALKRDPHGGDLYGFRGKSGKLIKILWHDGLGMSLYAKRLGAWPLDRYQSDRDAASNRDDRSNVQHKVCQDIRVQFLPCRNRSRCFSSTIEL
jgi:IS66 Orf2 like protein